jgi:hypothetical protein
LVTSDETITVSETSVPSAYAQEDELTVTSTKCSESQSVPAEGTIAVAIEEVTIDPSTITTNVLVSRRVVPVFYK